MPSPILNIQRFNQLGKVEDVNKFNKLPVYFMLQQYKQFPRWRTWGDLFGRTTWKQNMGNLMRGVAVEMSPNSSQLFLPQPITGTAHKDVLETNESTNDAIIRRHNYESPLIYFLPSFSDFRRQQIDPNIENLTRQMVRRDEQFLRTYCFEKLRYGYFCGVSSADGGQFQSMPYNSEPDFLESGMEKDQTWRQAMAAKLASSGNSFLTLRRLRQVALELRDALKAPFFEGMANKPKDNDVLAGKYCLTGSMEWWNGIIDDPATDSYKSIQLDMLHSSFTGGLFGNIMFKAEEAPMRMKADGSFPAPEIQDNDGRNIANPEYQNAPYEWAFLHGADTMDSIKVGPPPPPFSEQGNKMNLNKFSKLQWNGEVTVTDDVLIRAKDGSGNDVISTNNRGEFVQLISSVAHGAVMNRPNNSIAILYTRRSLEVDA